MTPNELKIHPLAEKLPFLPENEFAELKADIDRRGQREPILISNLLQRLRARAEARKSFPSARGEGQRFGCHSNGASGHLPRVGDAGRISQPTFATAAVASVQSMPPNERETKWPNRNINPPDRSKRKAMQQGGGGLKRAPRLNLKSIPRPDRLKGVGKKSVN